MKFNNRKTCNIANIIHLYLLKQIRSKLEFVTDIIVFEVVERTHLTIHGYVTVQIKFIWNLVCMGLRTLEWHKRGALPLELLKHFTFAIRLERAQNRASHRMALTHKTLTFTSAKLPADSVNTTSSRNASPNPILSLWKLVVLFYNETERDLSMQPNNQSEGKQIAAGSIITVHSGAYYL